MESYGANMNRHVQEMGYKCRISNTQPLMNQGYQKCKEGKELEPLLSGPKSSSQMRVAFAFDLEIRKVERHRIQVDGSPV